MVDHGRRRWLLDLIPRAMDSAATIVAEKLPRYTRPPGALSTEASFLTTCTRCKDCASACPHHAIFTLDVDAGLAANTPVMAPDERACHLCEGYPCIAACKDGALVPLEADVLPRFGYVTIDPQRCFTFMGPECGACGRLCPGGLEAITFRRNRPSVAHHQCIGCGICIEACPTRPVSILFHRGEAEHERQAEDP